MDISNSISESGGLNWKMTLCLLVAWSIVGMAVVKGIQSSGKVSRDKAAGTQRAGAWTTKEECFSDIASWEGSEHHYCR